MKILKTVLLAAGIAAAGAAHAVDMGIGLKVGTHGLGADLGFGLSERFTLRLGYSGLSWSGDFEEEDITYDTKLRLAAFSGLVDWKFWRQVRLTAGLVHVKDKGALTGTPTGGTFTINDVDYAASEVGTISGTVRMGKSATPYLGIGYGDIARKGLSFYADLGILFQGKPDVELSANCGATARCAQLQADVEAEERKLQEDLDKFKYYPILNLGIAYGW